jgi:hypothetical protein
MENTRTLSRLGAPRARAVPAAPVVAPQRPAPAAPSRTLLLTPDQAGDLLGVTARVMERWRGCGDGPKFARLSRKTIRYRVEDIEAFVAANLRVSTAPGAGRV